MSTMHRNPSPPRWPWPGWMAALRARLERSFGRGTPPTRAEPRVPVAPVVRALPVPSGLRVLVADDNPANLEEACALLEQCGVAALSAVDGVQAVALARAHDFDLILMDLQMPVLDGLAATMDIRVRERARGRPRVPVLAYTMTPLGDDLLRACGIDGVLDKPCSIGALREALQRWCHAEAAPHREAPAALGLRVLR